MINKALYQKTINRRVCASGTGVHSGDLIHLSLCPAPVDHGIVFCRKDVAGEHLIPAKVDYINSTNLCTTLSVNGVGVSTVEHLLSAAAGLGITNMLVELDGPEVPIMDGSSAPFVFLMQFAGIHKQDKLQPFLKILDEIVVYSPDGQSSCGLKPADSYKINFVVDFDHQVFDADNQSLSIDLHEFSYVSHLSRARTFGFLSDFERLHQANLALGASLDNSIGIDDQGVMNPEGLRFSNEPVRHKAVDVVGDLSLLGYPLIGEFSGFCSGHKMNKMLLEAITIKSNAWELICP